MVIEARVLNEMKIPHEELIHEGMRAVVFMMEYMNERILLPGQIENHVTIMNVGKLGVGAIDKKTLKSLIGNLSDYY